MSWRPRGSVAARLVGVVAVAALVSATSCEPEPDPAAPAVAVSPDQQQVVQELGQPPRFTLTFVDDGSPSVQGRYETWRYDAVGVTVSFIDGEQISRSDGPTSSADVLDVTPYQPGWFTDGMTVDQFLDVVGTSEFVEQQVGLGDGERGRLVVVQGAVAGFDEGGLAYVEAVPLAS